MFNVSIRKIDCGQTFLLCVKKTQRSLLSDLTDVFYPSLGVLHFSPRGTQTHNLRVRVGVGGCLLYEHPSLVISTDWNKRFLPIWHGSKLLTFAHPMSNKLNWFEHNQSTKPQYNINLLKSIPLNSGILYSPVNNLSFKSKKTYIQDKWIICISS